MTWEPTRWWRAVDADGKLWCESSNEAEVREAARPGDRVERLWREVKEEWRPVFATGGVVRAGSPTYETVPFEVDRSYVVRRQCHARADGLGCIYKLGHDGEHNNGSTVWTVDWSSL